MRFFVVLFASLMTLGCGNAAKGPDPHFVVGVFNPPAITELTPSSSPVNSVPFAMTVNGSNFLPDAVVFWNGTPMSTRYVMPNQLVALVTDTDVLITGLVHVYVRTGGLNSNTVDFNVTAQ
jgi:IPT/TIG domain